MLFYATLEMGWDGGDNVGLNRPLLRNATLEMGRD